MLRRSARSAAASSRLMACPIGTTVPEQLERRHQPGRRPYALRPGGRRAAGCSPRRSRAIKKPPPDVSGGGLAT
ncbi:hypothetical protein NH44784_027691 [Achromobacter xylosoxidans NH44784-1996]|nr:hypothetical protein NH44784_027691 [Achromobacter xylosoxidans NH44784-1996]